MRVALYRTFVTTIEVPDDLPQEAGIVDKDALTCYLDEEDCWPSLLDGEELFEEIEGSILED